jgi:hypothetical protein
MTTTVVCSVASSVAGMLALCRHVIGASTAYLHISSWRRYGIYSSDYHKSLAFEYSAVIDRCLVNVARQHKTSHPRNDPKLSLPLQHPPPPFVFDPPKVSEVQLSLVKADEEGTPVLSKQNLGITIYEINDRFPAVSGGPCAGNGTGKAGLPRLQTDRPQSGRRDCCHLDNGLFRPPLILSSVHRGTEGTIISYFPLVVTPCRLLPTHGRHFETISRSHQSSPLPCCLACSHRHFSAPSSGRSSAMAPGRLVGNCCVGN